VEPQAPTPDESSAAANEVVGIIREIFSTEHPEHVYHYTDIQGLIGILSTRTLWATDVAYMNDASEYAYGGTIVDEVITDTEREFARVGLLRKYLNTTATELGFRVYASCFCQTGDLLSQWRTYSKQGPGYAIEFRVDQLVASLSETEPSAFVGSVDYDPTRQRESVDRVVKNCIGPITTDPTGARFLRTPFAKVADGGAPPLDGTEATYVKEHLQKWLEDSMIGVVALVFARPFLKAPAFSEEEEWRIVIHSDTEGEEFRCSKGLLIPYRKLALGDAGKLPITSIRIGPNHPHPQQAKASLERFLRSKGLDRIHVDASPIPIGL